MMMRFTQEIIMSKLYVVTVGAKLALGSDGYCDKVESAKRLACKLFGGATVRCGNGVRHDAKDGTTEEEPTLSFEIVADSTPENFTAIEFFAAQCREQFEQKCVLLTATDCIKAFI
jgi:hypothetical protein